MRNIVLQKTFFNVLKISDLFDTKLNTYQYFTHYSKLHFIIAKQKSLSSVTKNILVIINKYYRLENENPTVLNNKIN